MATAEDSFSDEIGGEESMDADRVEVNRLLQILHHLSDSQFSLSKASEFFISGDSNARGRSHEASASSVWAYKSKVAGELVQVVNRIMEKKKVKPVFIWRPPSTDVEVDFLAQLATAVLNFPHMNPPVPSYDAVPVVNADKKGKGLAKIWGSVSQYAEEKAVLLGKGVDIEVTQLIQDTAVPTVLRAIHAVVEFLDVMRRTCFRKKKAENDDGAGASSSSGGRNQTEDLNTAAGRDQMGRVDPVQEDELDG